MSKFNFENSKNSKPNDIVVLGGSVYRADLTRLYGLDKTCKDKDCDLKVIDLNHNIHCSCIVAACYPRERADAKNIGYIRDVKAIGGYEVPICFGQACLVCKEPQCEYIEAIVNQRQKIKR